MSELASPQQVYMLQATDNNQAQLIPIEWRQFGAPCSSCTHTGDPRDCPFNHLNSDYIASSTTCSTSFNGDTGYAPIALQDIHFARDSTDPCKYIVTNLIAHDAAPIALGDLRIARDPHDQQRWIVINMVAASRSDAAAASAPKAASAASAARWSPVAAVHAARWNDVLSSGNHEDLANSEAADRLAAFHSFMHQQQLNLGYFAAAAATENDAHKNGTDEEVTTKEIKKEVKEEEIAE